MIKFLSEMQAWGDNIAFRILDGDSSINISFQQYGEMVQKCAYNLNQLTDGLKGKRVGIYCDSSCEYTMLVAAIMFSRAVAVPFNIRESIDNILYEVENAEIDYLVVDNDLVEEDSIKAKVLLLSDVFKSNGEKVELKDFSEEEKDSNVLMIYTSGTTGKPKGVVLSVGNIFGYRKSMYDENAPFEKLEGLRVYTNFPYYHIGGINGWITHFELGVTTYISKNPSNVLSDLEGETIDSAIVTPATLNLWKKTVSRGRMDRLGGAKLLVSAGAPVDITTVELFMEHGISYGQYYGMSESCGNITSNFDCKNHLKSVGKADPSVEVIIEDGEICVKGPGVMQEYYKNPEETEKTIINGVLHTGDLGYVAEDGYVYITGRKKNLIILSGGENVSPEELENALYKCEYVFECKVYAEDDRIGTTIYTDEENSETVLSFITELNSTLPIYKRIYRKNIQNVPLEKTASGKIKR
ncbi:class I adenylate-forming enzyme family protein [Pseudobutyrivibrio xylanivorans]|uniref:Long-chain acyl-CoA synthetase n=1 Tax=Pseudobutyrivibrio xylanivorans DSM 14809 TaxID=1123012 RepID=A0A1M6IE09_PSEXY|nr:class I adenylate-forming enzyme family protein [Pseudobutyrivibrio xylanivorans]SHJ32687.1 long-chain acyl-CoA synthetase [Pseudobutyrivibrio xylanivorans DSM 14809]